MALKLDPVGVVEKGPSTEKLIPASFHVPPSLMKTAPPESPEERCASFGFPFSSKAA